MGKGSGGVGWVGGWMGGGCVVVGTWILMGRGWNERVGGDLMMVGGGGFSPLFIGGGGGGEAVVTTPPPPRGQQVPDTWSLFPPVEAHTGGLSVQVSP